MTTIIRSVHIEEVAFGQVVVIVKLLMDKLPVNYVHHATIEPNSIAPENAYDLISAAISAALKHNRGIK